MEIVYVKDKEIVFGFMKNYPKICSQGKTEFEVKSKIEEYFKKFKEVFYGKDVGNDGVIKKAKAMIAASNSFKDVDEQYKKQLDAEDEKINEMKSISDGYEEMK